MDIPINVIAPLLILQLILLTVALVDLLRREPQRVKGSKWVWIPVIVLINTLGPIAYFIVGRKD